jgi:excisionase family DNA binding protein
MYEKLDRLTVVEAAERLGVKEQAVRKRIARGTLHHTKDEDGRVYVYRRPSDTDAKPESEGVGTGGDTDAYTLIRSLEDQVGYLRREVEDRKDESRRKDAIIMSLTQRIPELEAPAMPEPRGSSQAAAAEDLGRGQQQQPRSDAGEAGEGEKRRSSGWWRRLFGFE